MCCRIRFGNINDQASHLDIASNNIDVTNNDHYDNKVVTSCVYKRVQSDQFDDDICNDNRSDKLQLASTLHEVVTSNGTYPMDYVFDKNDTQVRWLCFDHHHLHLCWTSSSSPPSPLLYLGAHLHHYDTTSDLGCFPRLQLLDIHLWANRIR